METYSLSWLLSNHSALQSILNKYRHSPNYPRCLCSQKEAPLYIGKKSFFYLAKMPGTGFLHHPGCPFYGSSDAVSSSAKSDSIKSLANGKCSIAVDLDLRRERSPSENKADDPKTKHFTGISRSKITPLGFLRYLWEQSHLNHWSCNMKGKRWYGTFCNQITKLSSTLLINGVTLSRDCLFGDRFGQRRRSNILAS